MTTSRAPSPVNVDMRSNESNMSSSPAQGAPTYKDSYFFLPALGYYGYGAINEMGSTGYYWTSTRTPDDTNWAYRLKFDSSSIGLMTDDCYAGYYVMNMN
jgi:putative lipoprotein